MVIEREIPLNVIRPGDPVTGRIVESSAVTDKSSPNYCRHIVIDISGTSLEGNFEAGQAFGVIPRWDRKADDNGLRLYSIASPTTGEFGEGHTISTTVKRIITEETDDHQLKLGTASNYLCDLNEGETVNLTGPTGKQMLLPDRGHRNDHNYVFIATGTGIAPFRGMVIELLENGFDGEIHLIFGVPYRTDVYYEALFRRFEAKYPNFHFYTALSREEQTRDGTRMYVHDRMAVEWERLEPILRESNTLAYICGMAGMENGVYRLLLQHRLHEYFDSLPTELLESNPDPLYDYDEVINSLRPDTQRMRVEVY
ncbi:MAG: hypothetical protein K9N46_16175 [Candidatus Marinimicrobia bacterium]|nr:hypothetical protein [Candidatus Neomarinimicrobiota bacterium]MCF7830241.1 hypothetical protein [Candidatus Neomarinimicrobiota bacterium]MCF7882268.1 hypothetical protein [Candidatus Neomarinimicrobiota bacterium]